MNQSYTTPITFSTNLGKQPVEIISHMALPNSDRVTPAALLLWEHAGPALASLPQGKALLLGCGHGGLATALARRAPQLDWWLHDTSSIALECCTATLSHNQVHNTRLFAEISLLPEHAGQFAAVLIEAPKGRDLTRRWLVEAFFLLQPGGLLFLAGENDLGIQSCVHDAARLFGNCNVLDYKKGSRVAKALRPPVTENDEKAGGGWARQAGIAPGTWITYPLMVQREARLIYTLPGVFSADGLDEGTAMLLGSLTEMGAPPAAGERILDVGCGSGVIGLYTSLNYPQAVIDLVDSNLLATACAQRTLITNGIPQTQAQVFPSDLLAAVNGRSYRWILSNPPFHSGKETNYEIARALIQQAYQALLPDGRLRMVANSFIRYDQIMELSFRKANIRIIATTPKFHLIEARK